LRVSISTPALDVSADWGKFADASPANSMALLLSVGSKLKNQNQIPTHIENPFFNLAPNLLLFLTCTMAVKGNSEF
jgi:hypothetical protein